MSKRDCMQGCAFGHLFWPTKSNLACIKIFTHPVGIGEVESDVERGSLHETSYWSIVPLSCITIERNSHDSTNLYKRFSMQKIVQQQQRQINCQLDGCTHAGFRMDRLCECCPESRSSEIVPEGR